MALLTIRLATLCLIFAELALDVSCSEDQSLIHHHDALAVDDTQGDMWMAVDAAGGAYDAVSSVSAYGHDVQFATVSATGTVSYEPVRLETVSYEDDSTKPSTRPVIVPDWPQHARKVPMPLFASSDGIKRDDDATITWEVAKTAALQWGRGFDIIHESFGHSHLRVYFAIQKALMKNHSLNALNAVQAECGPKKVLVAGLPRSGSTSLFELVQILLYYCDAHFRPWVQTLESPYFTDDERFSWEPFIRNSSESAIVKTHTAVSDLRLSFPDKVFLSHRDPAAMLHSQWLSWHGTESTCPGGEAPPCNGWPTCQREMERQACLYEMFPRHKIAYDMSLDELISSASSKHRVVKELALALGFPKIEALDDLISSAVHIYDQVKADIQFGIQSTHRNVDKWKTEAGLEVQHEMIYQRGVASGTRLVLNGKEWAIGKGSIQSNPMFNTTAHHMFPVVRDNVCWHWCKKHRLAIPTVS